MRSLLFVSMLLAVATACAEPFYTEDFSHAVFKIGGEFDSGKRKLSFGSPGSEAPYLQFKEYGGASKDGDGIAEGKLKVALKEKHKKCSANWLVVLDISSVRTKKLKVSFDVSGFHAPKGALYFSALKGTHQGKGYLEFKITKATATGSLSNMRHGEIGRAGPLAEEVAITADGTVHVDITLPGKSRQGDYLVLAWTASSLEDGGADVSASIDNVVIETTGDMPKTKKKPKVITLG